MDMRAYKMHATELAIACMPAECGCRLQHRYCVEGEGFFMDPAVTKLKFFCARILLLFV
jgi:hypothetical protein